MAKTNMSCPFTHKLCAECAVYRGRHYYLSFCKQYRGYMGESKQPPKSSALRHSVTFQALKNPLAPWASLSDQAKTELKIKLKVIDVEGGETRMCQLEEARTWDWDNPELVRVVGDLQITSWDKLVEVLRFKAEKGYQEVVVYEFPRFMLLAGG